jgi:hypothetical protein
MQSVPLIVATLSVFFSSPVISAPQDLPAPSQPLGQWRNLNSLPRPRQEHGTVAINGTTLAIVAGTFPVLNDTTGLIMGLETTDSIQLYDIPSDTWRNGTPTPYRVNHPNVISVDGLVYLLGGLVDVPNLEGPMADWEATGESHVWNPETDEWTQLESMPPGTARGSSVLGVHDDLIYVAGGLTVLNIDYQDAVSLVTAFNITSGQWQRLPEHAANIPHPRQHMTGGVAGDILYVIGGRWFEKTNVRGTVFMLNLTHQEAGWSTANQRMPTYRGGLSGAAVGNRFFAFGGEANPDNPNGIFPETESFDLETQQWRELRPMPVPRHGSKAVAVGNAIYLPGGGLQDDGLPVEANGVTTIVQTTDHFDAFIVED